MSTPLDRTPQATAPAAQQVESTIDDPYAGRRENADKLRQSVLVLFGLVETLLAIRFLLRLLGANAQAGFAQLIYGVTAPLVAPFQGLFGSVQADSSVLESASLVALIVYALVAWLVVKLAALEQALGAAPGALGGRSRREGQTPRRGRTSAPA